MTNYNLGEGQSVYEELENNNKIVVGDTITFAPYNQQGYMKYEVIMGDNGKKTLEVIDSYDRQMEHNYDDENSYQSPEKDDSYQSTVKDEYEDLGKRSYDDNGDVFTKRARYDEKGGKSRKSRKGRKSRKSKKSKKGKKSRKGRKGRKSLKTRK